MANRFKPKKSAVVAVTGVLSIGFVIGLLYATRLSKNTQPIDQLSDSAKLADLKLKLAHFSANDLEDYTRLKNLEERYKKADELVGKMILILLSDVGVRVGENQEAFLKTVTSTSSPISKSSLNVPAKTEEAPAPSAVTVPKQNWLSAEKQLNRLNTESDIAKMLASTVIDNLGDAIRLSKVPAQDEIKKYISGCFSGEVLFQNQKPKWDLFVDIRPIDASNAKPSSHIRAIENGSEIIGNESDGEIRGIRRFANESQAVILNLNRSWYAQLYYIQAKDIFVGNIYKDTDVMQFEHRGTVRLARNTNCN